MKIVLPVVLTLFSGVVCADPITPIVNPIIAPTGLQLPSLPIPGAPGGAPGLPGLPSGLPSELPGLPAELPGPPGGLPELPGLGGGGAPELPDLPLPGVPSGPPEIPGGVPSPVGLLVGAIPFYGEINYVKGEIIGAVLGPVNLILAQNMNPTDYQAEIMKSLLRIQNALALPSGGL